MDALPAVLYLVHRIPYPPNKGDKVRSFNILRQLALTHRVYLGTFVDHPDDVKHVERLREWCVETHVVRLDPRRARVASLRGLISGEALSLPYYRDATLARWTRDVVRRENIRHAVAFSGPMAQYLDLPELDTRIIDFCDLDSAKWTQYAAQRRWPMSWLYRREGECLLSFERCAARTAAVSTFVTEAEAGLFKCAAPEVADRVVAVQNGVNAEYFSPERSFDDPYPEGGPTILFTGAMDYWPNVDAVSWFVAEILPRIRTTYPDVRFFIVGMNPAPEVEALAGDGVIVTGTVPDVRPWLAHADVVAAPLRVARGIQNKVLEAMAMGRPVVVSTQSATGLAGQDRRDFLTASDAEQFAAAIGGLLANPASCSAFGARARECVVNHYSWQAHLQVFSQMLDSAYVCHPVGSDIIQGAHA